MTAPGGTLVTVRARLSLPATLSPPAGTATSTQWSPSLPTWVPPPTTRFPRLVAPVTHGSEDTSGSPQNPAVGRGHSHGTGTRGPLSCPPGKDAASPGPSPPVPTVGSHTCPRNTAGVRTRPRGWHRSPCPLALGTATSSSKPRRKDVTDCEPGGAGTCPRPRGQLLRVTPAGPGRTSTSTGNTGASGAMGQHGDSVGTAFLVTG